MTDVDDELDRQAGLASAAIEEAARLLPPLPVPVIDAQAAGFGPGPVPQRIEVTYTLYDSCAEQDHCAACTADNAVTGGFAVDCCRCGAKWAPGGWVQP